MSRLRRRRLALMRDAVFKGRIKAVSGYPVSLSRAVSLYSAEISGNSVQNGTPSPTEPIEIQSVGEKTANLFKADFSDTVSQGIMYIKLSPNTAYSLKYKTTKSILYINAVDEAVVSTQLARREIGNGVVNFTTEATGEICIRLTKPSTFEDFDLWALVKGTYTAATMPFEPYGYKIPLRFKGRNLFDPNDDDIVLHGRLGLIEQNYSEIWTTDEQAKERFVSGLIPVKEGCIYSLNTRSTTPNPAYDRFAIYNSDKKQIKAFTDSFNGFTVPADGCYLRFTGLIDKLDKIIVQEGAVTADNVVYEPYINDVFDIYLDEPLRKIGSYTDSISVDFERKSAVVVRNVKTLVLGGKENWTAFAAYSDRVKAYLNGYSQMEGCKSTHFVYAGAQTSTAIKGGEFSINAATFNLALPIALADTLDEMKTWLGENKPEFYIGQTAKSYDVSSMQKWEAAPSFGRFDVSLSADTAVSPLFDEVRYWCEG